jgi:hypothetical protein
MTSNKKPDNIVFNNQEQRYDASLKPYATNVGAPVITTVDTVSWKNVSIQKVNHHIEARYKELKSAYEKMIEDYELNTLIYSAKFNFEPMIGETYHLYRDLQGDYFLSIIGPKECNFDFVGSYYLDADRIWKDLSSPAP